jgi:protease-4
MALIRKILASLNVLRGVRWLALMLANWRKRRFKALEYVILSLPTKLTPLPEKRRWFERLIWGEPPLNLFEMAQVFDRMAEDNRIQGVILYLREPDMSLADLTTLRDLLSSLRRRGKRVVCLAHAYTTRTYFLASAADDVVLHRGGEFATMGLHGQAMFMRDALAAVGLQVEVVQISPYKSALDAFSQQDISPEFREQVDWLLDSTYAHLTAAMAEARDMTPEAVHAMIDGAPYPASAALEAGFVDAVLTQEELPGYLEVTHIADWEQAVKKLPRRWERRHDKYVAVLRLSGMQLEGESRQPPAPIPVPLAGEEVLGNITVVEEIRNLMEDEQAAAVVLHVDCPGGAEAGIMPMTAALRELAKDRPLVAYMNSVAASGGYEICTPAAWIVAQPLTTTGSIGVASAKVVSGEMFDKLRFNLVDFTRGANATLYAAGAPWSEAQRAQMQTLVEHGYRQFLADVAEGRQMSVEAVDAVAGGRVWTGAQALEHGLVDQLGGLDAAVARARDLAGLPDDAPCEVFHSAGKPLGPKLAEVQEPAAVLWYLQRNLASVLGGQRLRVVTWTVDWR